MPEKPSKDKKNDKGWYEVENRLTIPSSFEGEYEIRQEPVNRDAIIKFMNHVATRRASGKRGRLIHNLAMLLLHPTIGPRAHSGRCNGSLPHQLRLRNLWP